MNSKDLLLTNTEIEFLQMYLTAIVGELNAKDLLSNSEEETQKVARTILEKLEATDE